jgi:imidazolonepropionase
VPDLVVRRAGVLLTIPASPTAGDALGRIEKAALVAQDGRVTWVGLDHDLPADRISTDALEIDAGGALVSPGLVDPHTHPLFDGNRADEFERRAAGATYLEIASAGGGIRSTVRATRVASDEALVARARARLETMLAQGTTACEAKTGYALTPDGELRLLGLLARLNDEGPVRLSPTLLAAHAVPPEIRDAEARAAWVSLCAGDLCRAAAVHGARSVDVYADQGAYTPDEARTILEGAHAAGLATRLHADQIAEVGGAALAAALGCVSADHLENVSTKGVQALAASKTVAVCLPGAAMTLRLPPPPARALVDAGACVALGTDLNPGSSLTESMPLQMWLATTWLRLTVDEAWRGATLHAARAALLPGSGSLMPGSHADLVVWDAVHPAEICQHYGVPLARRVFIAGRSVVGRVG